MNRKNYLRKKQLEYRTQTHKRIEILCPIELYRDFEALKDQYNVRWVSSLILKLAQDNTRQFKIPPEFHHEIQCFGRDVSSISHHINQLVRYTHSNQYLGQDDIAELKAYLRDLHHGFQALIEKATNHDY